MHARVKYVSLQRLRVVCAFIVYGAACFVLCTANVNESDYSLADNSSFRDSATLPINTCSRFLDFRRTILPPRMTENSQLDAHAATHKISVEHEFFDASLGLVSNVTYNVTVSVTSNGSFPFFLLSRTWTGQSMSVERSNRQRSVEISGVFGTSRNGKAISCEEEVVRIRPGPVSVSLSWTSPLRSFREGNVTFELYVQDSSIVFRQVALVVLPFRSGCFHVVRDIKGSLRSEDFRGGFCNDRDADLAVALSGNGARVWLKIRQLSYVETSLPVPSLRVHSSVKEETLDFRYSPGSLSDHEGAQKETGELEKTISVSTFPLFISKGNWLILRVSSCSAGCHWVVTHSTLQSAISGCNITLSDHEGELRSVGYPDYFDSVSTSCYFGVVSRFSNQSSVVVVTFQDWDLPCDVGYIELNNGQKLCGGSGITGSLALRTNATDGTLFYLRKTASDGAINHRGFLLSYGKTLTPCRNETVSDQGGQTCRGDFPAAFLSDFPCSLTIHVPLGYSLRANVSLVRKDSTDAATITNANYDPEDCSGQEFSKLRVYGVDMDQRLCTRKTFHQSFNTQSNILKVSTRSSFDGVANVTDLDGQLCVSYLAVNTNDSLTSCPYGWTGGGIHCYKVFSDATLPWQDANKDCENHGGHLASVTNEDISILLERLIRDSLQPLKLDRMKVEGEEYDWSERHKELLAGSRIRSRQEEPGSSGSSERSSSSTSRGFWIGGSDRRYENCFEWASGEPFSYTNWFSGWPQHSWWPAQPSDDGDSHQDCIEMSNVFRFPSKGEGTTNKFYWNDRGCEVRNPYICQRLKPGATPVILKTEDCNRTIILTPDSPRDVVTSPGYPTPYPPNTKCFYTIMVPPKKRLEIIFTDFVLEEHVSCEYDYLELGEHLSKDFKTGKHHRVCGNWVSRIKLLRTISSGEIFEMRFVSDFSHHFRGFRAEVFLHSDSDATETSVCGSDSFHLYRNSCYFVSSYPELSWFTANKVCNESQGQLAVRLNDGERVFLDTLIRKSFVTVGPGNPGTSSSALYWLGATRRKKPTRLSEDADYYTEVRTRNNKGRMEPASNRDRYRRDKEQDLWRWMDGVPLVFNEQERLKEAEEFQISRNPNYDTDQEDETGYPSTACLSYQWRRQANNGSDFVLLPRNCEQPARYICQKRALEVPGNLNRTVSGPYGSMKSVNHPNHYPNDMHYTETIEATLPPKILGLSSGRSKRSHRRVSVAVTFDQLELEWQEQCMYDYVSLSSRPQSDVAGRSSKMIRLCSPADIRNGRYHFISDGPIAYITFHSDYSISAPGFSLTWAAVEYEHCQDMRQGGRSPETYSVATHTIHLLPGDHPVTLTSALYPRGYPPNLSCPSLTLRAPDGYRVLLTIADFDAGGSGDNGSCTGAWLELNLGLYSGHGMKTRLCGGHSRIPSGRQFISYENYALVSFKTGPDGSAGKHRGYNVTAMAWNGTVLNGFLKFAKDVSGSRFSSLNYPLPIPKGIEQSVYLIAPIGKQIAISIASSSGSMCRQESTLMLEDRHAPPSSLAKWTICPESNSVTLQEVTLKSTLNTMYARMENRVSNKSNPIAGASTFVAEISIKEDPLFRNRTLAAGHSNYLFTCEMSPCQNGGECLKVDDEKYECKCKSHFRGLFCHLTACDFAPCGSRGVCNLTKDGYGCNCFPSYTGVNCNETATPCSSRPCGSHGACSIVNDTFSCKCQLWYEGARCDRYVFRIPYKPLSQRMLEEPFWLGLITVSAVLVLILFVYCIKRKFADKIEKLLAEEIEKSKNTVSLADPSPPTTRYSFSSNPPSVTPASLSPQSCHRSFFGRIRKQSIRSSTGSPDKDPGRAFSFDDILRRNSSKRHSTAAIAAAAACTSNANNGNGSKADEKSRILASLVTSNSNKRRMSLDEFIRMSERKLQANRNNTNNPTSPNRPTSLDAVKRRLQDNDDDDDEDDASGNGDVSDGGGGPSSSGQVMETSFMNHLSPLLARYSAPSFTEFHSIREQSVEQTSSSSESMSFDQPCTSEVKAEISPSPRLSPALLLAAVKSSNSQFNRRQASKLGLADDIEIGDDERCSSRQSASPQPECRGESPQNECDETCCEQNCCDSPDSEDEPTRDVVDNSQVPQITIFVEDDDQQSSLYGNEYPMVSLQVPTSTAHSPVSPKTPPPIRVWSPTPKQSLKSPMSPKPPMRKEDESDRRHSIACPSDAPGCSFIELPRSYTPTSQCCAAAVAAAALDASTQVTILSLPKHHITFPNSPKLKKQHSDGSGPPSGKENSNVPTRKYSVELTAPKILITANMSSCDSDESSPPRTPNPAAKNMNYLSPLTVICSDRTISESNLSTSGYSSLSSPGLSRCNSSSPLADELLQDQNQMGGYGKRLLSPARVPAHQLQQHGHHLQIPCTNAGGLAPPTNLLLSPGFLQPKGFAFPTTPCKPSGPSLEIPPVCETVMSVHQTQRRGSDGAPWFVPRKGVGVSGTLPATVSSVGKERLRRKGSYLTTSTEDSVDDEGIVVDPIDLKIRRGDLKSAKELELYMASRKFEEPVRDTDVSNSSTERISQQESRGENNQGTHVVLVVEDDSQQQSQVSGVPQKQGSLSTPSRVSSPKCLPSGTRPERTKRHSTGIGTGANVGDRVSAEKCRKSPLSSPVPSKDSLDMSWENVGVRLPRNSSRSSMLATTKVVSSSDTDDPEFGLGGGGGSSSRPHPPKGIPKRANRKSEIPSRTKSDIELREFSYDPQQYSSSDVGQYHSVVVSPVSGATTSIISSSPNTSRTRRSSSSESLPSTTEDQPNTEDNSSTDGLGPGSSKFEPAFAAVALGSAATESDQPPSRKRRLQDDTSWASSSLELTNWSLPVPEERLIKTRSQQSLQRTCPPGWRRPDRVKSMDSRESSVASDNSDEDRLIQHQLSVVCAAQNTNPSSSSATILVSPSSDGGSKSPVNLHRSPTAPSVSSADTLHHLHVKTYSSHPLRRQEALQPENDSSDDSISETTVLLRKSSPCPTLVVNSRSASRSSLNKVDRPFEESRTDSSSSSGVGGGLLDTLPSSPNVYVSDQELPLSDSHKESGEFSEFG